MSHQNLSPRQKMISMMYLVLTAMLAMNVSKEILNAFTVVNEGIENSNLIVQKRNTNMYNNILELSNNNTDSAKADVYSLITETQILTNNAIDYIDVLKIEILEKSGRNDNPKSRILFAKLDDQETATRILTEASGNFKSKGELLREELFQIQSKYLDIIDRGNATEKNTNSYINYKELFKRKLQLQAPNKNQLSLEGESVSWVNKNFFQVPVVATNVILSKLQNDIYSSEAQVIEYLYKQLDAKLPKFNKLKASVISPKSYLPSGKIFKADIFIAASSSEQISEVFIGTLNKDKFSKDENGNITKTHVSNDDLLFTSEYNKIPVKDGKARFENITSGIGQKNYEGLIRVKIPTGGYDLYPFEFDYEVAPKSTFSVSPIAMNVLYIGLDNPLSIAVSGSKDSDISTTISSGKLLKKGNIWYAYVSKQGEVQLDVFGIIDGDRKKIGTQEFRVKRIPDPIATLDGVEYPNSRISKSRIQQHNSVFPLLKDFVYDVRYKVVSYDFTIKTKGKDIFSVRNIRKSVFPKKVKTLISNANSNDIVFFRNIKVVGPDNKSRKINSLVLTIF